MDYVCSIGAVSKVFRRDQNDTCRVCGKRPAWFRNEFVVDIRISNIEHTVLDKYVNPRLTLNWVETSTSTLGEKTALDHLQCKYTILP